MDQSLHVLAENTANVDCVGATFFAAITECLNEAAADGLCYSYGVLSGFGTMPNWDTSEVTNMNGAFSNRATLEADLSGWNTAQVTDMRNVSWCVSFQRRYFELGYV